MDTSYFNSAIVLGLGDLAGSLLSPIQFTLNKPINSEAYFFPLYSLGVEMGLPSHLQTPNNYFLIDFTLSTSTTRCFPLSLSVSHSPSEDSVSFALTSFTYRSTQLESQHPNSFPYFLDNLDININTNINFFPYSPTLPQPARLHILGGQSTSNNVNLVGIIYTDCLICFQYYKITMLSEQCLRRCLWRAVFCHIKFHTFNFLGY